MAVGGSGVANYANTTPGTAAGVVAYTYTGGIAGLEVGGDGTVTFFSPLPPPPPSSFDFQFGSTITDVYQGDTFTAADTTQWLANTSTAPFAYSSTYSALPTALLCPHALMAGPMANGLWEMRVGGTYAYSASGTITCITSAGYGDQTYVEGDATNGYIYYTSTNDGASYTRRTQPNTKKYSIGFTAGLFIGATGLGDTTNGIITSTDAVTWSGKTASAAFDQGLTDIVSNGSTQIVLFPANSDTTAMYSLDSGVTWSAATVTAPQTVFFGFNTGFCTYNAGAGLFIGNVGTAGSYQTSPTGATWTLRNTIATYQPYGTLFGTTCRYASSSTTTVAIATNGYFAVTTDGLVWTDHNFIVGTGPTTNLVSAIYYDGTRFVITGTTGRIFYSTNGVAWTEGRPAPGAIIIPSNDRHLRILGTALLESKALIVTDPTSTTAQTVTSLDQSSAAAATNTYTRIL